MRIACISDVHGNLYALKKVFRIIEKSNIDRIIFLGDAIGYIPGVQVVKLLQELDIKCLMGNHEEMLLNGNYTKEKDKFYQHGKTLSKSIQKEIEFIKSWPDQLSLNEVSFFHASPNDHLNEYIYPDTELATFVPLLKDVRYCVIGHTHRPFIRHCNNIIFINTGSIGLPRDDGRYGSFAVIDTLTDVANIVRFDITAETAKSIAEFGPVHNSVLDLTNRHSKGPIEGEMLDG